MALIDKETIRKEIERLKKETTEEFLKQRNLLGEAVDYWMGQKDAVGKVLAFLDTLPEQEHPIYELNQILLDWVREAKTDKEHEARFEAHKRFFELYDEYMEQEPKQPVSDELEKEIERYYKENGWNYYVPYFSEFRNIARHFAEWGAEHLKK